MRENRTRLEDSYTYHVLVLFRIMGNLGNSNVTGDFFDIGSGP